MGRRSQASAAFSGVVLLLSTAALVGFDAGPNHDDRSLESMVLSGVSGTVAAAHPMVDGLPEDMVGSESAPVCQSV